MRAESGGGSARDALKDAKDFLLQTLADNGPTPAKDIDEAAGDEGISETTLKRAKVALKKDGKIERVKDGVTGPWIWKLSGRDGGDTSEEF